MDPGLARLTRKTPCATRRWLGAFGFPPTGIIDTVKWGTWVAGPNYIGSVYLDPIEIDDILYVSYGSSWVNIQWTTLVVGQRIQIRSQDGSILYQDWNATGPFVEQAPGGHVAVHGVPPLVSPAVDNAVQCVWLL